MKICSMFTRKPRQQKDLTNVIDTICFISSVMIIMVVVLSNITTNIIKIMEANAAMKLGEYDKVSRILSRKDGIIL